MTNAPHTQPLVDSFLEAWRQVVSAGDTALASTALRSWLDESSARAVGWWRREGERLKLISFEAAANMPPEVRIGFADAMRDVSLDQIQLGCVRAAAEQRPVVAREDAATRGLSGSATWLTRFEAQQSLAIPIVNGSTVSGVLAIATAAPFDESSTTWELLVALVEAIGRESNVASK